MGRDPTQTYGLVDELGMHACGVTAIFHAAHQFLLLFTAEVHADPKVVIGELRVEGQAVAEIGAAKHCHCSPTSFVFDDAFFLEKR